MLIKRRDETPIIAAAPAAPPRGPLPRRPQRLLDASASYAGVYLRPNRLNGGTLPVSGALCNSPDICIANAAPLERPRQLLADEGHYAEGRCDSHIETRMPNYIYVRGYNNTGSTQTRQVYLHHAPASVIQWPSLWRQNRIPAADGSPGANLVVAAQSVGVADQPFVWADPPPPPPGSDHHALIAQLGDATGSNACPEITRAIDMAALVTHDLGWGWKNASFVPAPRGASFAYTTRLEVPPEVCAPGNTFLVWVSPVRYAGWSVQFSCSQADSDGRTFSLGPQPVPITADGQIIGLVVTLEPGFRALLTVTLHSNGLRQLPGASLPLMCSYQACGTHAEEAYARGLVDPVFMRAVNSGRRGTRHNLGNTPTAYVGLGGYTWATPARA